MAGSNDKHRETASTPGHEPIDVVCPAPSGTSLVQLDRFLFSLVLQSYPELHVTIVLDEDAYDSGRAAAEKFDWTRWPRPPVFVRHPGGRRDERIWRALALGQATRRFVGIVDARGTLYTRAFELLMAGMRRSRAAVVFGDSIVKDMRAYPTFVYETKRHYLGAWSSGVLQLQAGWLPPLAACLLDLDRISHRDLDGRSGGGEDEAVVARLFSRYPAVPIEERVPLYARDRHVSHEGSTPPPTSGTTFTRRPADRVVHAFRDLRRRATP